MPGNRDGNKIIVPKINTLVSHSKRLENVFHSVDGKSESDAFQRQFEFFKAICVKPCRINRGVIWQ